MKREDRWFPGRTARKVPAVAVKGLATAVNV